MIFVYTDGVPEATNANNELFDTERMVTALNSKENMAPKEVLETVRASVDEFVGKAEQFDDLTMLCLEYRDPGEEQAGKEQAKKEQIKEEDC
jgi:sigma-B regulation protein RsbU (phosphoserine phosphatase)